MGSPGTAVLAIDATDLRDSNATASLIVGEDTAEMAHAIFLGSVVALPAASHDAC